MKIFIHMSVRSRTAKFRKTCFGQAAIGPDTKTNMTSKTAMAEPVYFVMLPSRTAQMHSIGTWAVIFERSPSQFSRKQCLLKAKMNQKMMSRLKIRQPRVRISTSRSPGPRNLCRLMYSDTAIKTLAF